MTLTRSGTPTRSGTTATLVKPYSSAAPTSMCGGGTGGLTAARGPTRRPVGDEGSVSAKLAVATPLLLLMILAVLQAGLWSHATHIAQAAAVQGLGDLRAETGTEASACAQTRLLLDQLGHGPLTVTDVACTRTADTAVVEVHGTAAAVFPLATIPVRARASGPVERFVPDLPT